MNRHTNDPNGWWVAVRSLGLSHYPISLWV